jgi:hypothetical protein
MITFLPKLSDFKCVPVTRISPHLLPYALPRRRIANLIVPDAKRTAVRLTFSEVSQIDPALLSKDIVEAAA